MRSEEEREARLKELALQMAGAIDRLRPEKSPPPVLSLVQGARREPQLSDAELIAVRQMLSDFERVAYNCPTARCIIESRD